MAVRNDMMEYGGSKYKKAQGYLAMYIFYIAVAVMLTVAFAAVLRAVIPTQMKVKIQKMTSTVFQSYGIKVFEDAVPLYQYAMGKESAFTSPSQFVYKYIKNQFPIGIYVEKTNQLVSNSELGLYMAEDQSRTSPSVSIGDMNIKPETYTLAQLSNPEFMLKTFFTVDSTTSVKKSEVDAAYILSKKFNVNLRSNKPTVLIYSTHGSEEFVDSRRGVTGDTIIGVGENLKQLLEEEYGVTVIHDRTVYDMIQGKLDRSYAYNLAEQSISRILEKNPSIQVVIDLHRDGVAGNTRLVTDVNGEKTAQIMFFNGVCRKKVGNQIQELTGTPNPFIKSNIALSVQMQLQAAKDYPDYTRRIYIKGYRYNQHLKDKSLLVEVGAQTNTVSEVKNAMIPLADLINKVLGR